MTEEEYSEFVLEQRLLGRQFVDDQLMRLRRRLWPKPPGAFFYEDPIDRENELRRWRVHLAARSYYGAGVLEPLSVFKVLGSLA